jgi:hypothetical protein
MQTVSRQRQKGTFTRTDGGGKRERRDVFAGLDSEVLGGAFVADLL